MFIKLRVVSDRYDGFSDGLGEDTSMPVDMYGKRVWDAKRDSNFEEAAEDIKQYYGLTGKAGLSNKNK